MPAANTPPDPHAALRNTNTRPPPLALLARLIDWLRGVRQPEPKRPVP